MVLGPSQLHGLYVTHIKDHHLAKSIRMVPGLGNDFLLCVSGPRALCCKIQKCFSIHKGTQTFANLLSEGKGVSKINNSFTPLRADHRQAGPN